MSKHSKDGPARSLGTLILMAEGYRIGVFSAFN